MAGSVRITGTGKLRAQLLALADRLKQAGEQAERDAAEEVQDDMRAFVPVDSGRLHDAIRIENGATGLQVGPGDEVEYAMFVEYGTSRMSAQPYAGPAADRARAAFVNTVRDTARRAV